MSVGSIVRESNLDSDASGSTPTGGQSSAWNWIAVALLALSIVAAVFLSFKGYGDDPDIFLSFATWQHVIIHGQYLPSRTPGHIVPEVVTGALSSFLPMYACNLFMVVVGAIGVAVYYFLFRKHVSAAYALVATVFVATNPAFIIAVSSSNDWGMAATLWILGIAAVIYRYPGIAAALFAVATSARPEYGILSFAVLLIYGGIGSPRRWLSGLLYAGLFGFIALLLWLPVLMSEHFSLIFIQPQTPVSGGFLGRFGRWVYKFLDIFGFPAAVVMVVAFVAALFRRRKTIAGELADTRGLLLPATLACAYILLFFLWYPINQQALLPMVLAVPVAAFVWGVPRSMVVIAALCQVFYWFVGIELLRIDYWTHGIGKGTLARSATFDPHLGPGALVNDAGQRPLVDAYFLPMLPSAPMEVFSTAAKVGERGQLQEIENIYTGLSPKRD